MSMDVYDDRPDGCAGDAAPYVLGALSEREHEAFVKHLETCAVCREEVASLQAVAAVLPEAAVPLRAPKGLKRSVMAEVRNDERVRRSTTRTRRAERSPFRWALVPALGVAGAAVAAIVIATGGSGSGSRVIPAEVLAPRASATLHVTGSRAELDISNLPQTQPGRVYEVWIKRAGAPQPTNALFTVTSSGSATVGVPGSVAGASEVLVSSEPLGGSRVPTRTPVIVAHLS